MAHGADVDLVDADEDDVAGLSVVAREAAEEEVVGVEFGGFEVAAAVDEYDAGEHNGGDEHGRGGGAMLFEPAEHRVALLRWAQSQLPMSWKGAQKQGWR